MKKIAIKFSNFYFKFSPYLLAFLIALILGTIMYCLFFYVHEGGHIFFGFFTNLISNGETPKFEISNWIDFPFLRILKLPQQTRIINGYPSLGFVLGGIIFVIIVSTFISYRYFKHSKNRYKQFILLFPIILTMHEILGNFLCGTDNLIGSPNKICLTSYILNYIIQLIPYLLTIPFFFLLIPFMQKIIKKIIYQK